jgi:hypothetical protein
MPGRIDRASATVAAALLASGSVGGGRARANPRPLPFTYQSETLPEGAGEVEQFVDFTPVRVLSGVNGAPVWYNATQFQTELEYGVTSRLEVALYFTLVPRPGDAFASLPVMPLGNGVAERVRYRLSDPGFWPVDVALYGEVVENEREIELEAKVILQRRAGALRLITNVWAERELYFDGRREWVLNPTAGATYEVRPQIHLGLEGWMRAEYLDGAQSRGYNMGPHVFVGPAALLNFGRLWWTFGAYARADDPGRVAQVGDAYGRLWVRTIVGVGL